MSAKPVIFMMADSLLAEAIEEGISRDELPALRFMTERGHYFRDFVSSFPTMSVVIESSLFTGFYPDIHRVPGLIWYSAERNGIVNYGTGPMEIWRGGYNEVLMNALFRLNATHLNSDSPTLYEELAKLGKTSGSLNGLVYRGMTEHTLSFPALLRLFTDLPGAVAVKAPDIFTFGAFSSLPQGMRMKWYRKINRLGFTNRYAFDAATSLVRSGSLPDFLYVYLPDMDKPLHRKGPPGLKEVKKTDAQLWRFLQAFGSPEQALRQAVVIVAGDSGVSSLRPSREGAVIYLHELLKEYRIMPIQARAGKDTDLVLAVNETMAYVYVVNPRHRAREVAGALRGEHRIAFAAWKDGTGFEVIQGGTGKSLRFQEDGELRDTYGQTWTITGDTEVLDVTIQAGTNDLLYGEYPDGLKRLSAALSSHPGIYLAVCAKPGYEFADRHSPLHPGGGAHGSLHRQDSLFPLIICGTGRVPAARRIVDLKPYLFDLIVHPE